MLLFTPTGTFEWLLVDSLSVLVVLILLGLSVLTASWRTNITEPVRTDTSSLDLFMSCHHMSCGDTCSNQINGESQFSIKEVYYFEQFKAS